MHAAPRSERYRTRARLSVLAGSGAHAAKVTVGYRVASSHTIENIRSCHVLHEALEPLLAELSQLLAREEGSGEASIALGRDGKPVLSLSWKRELSEALFSGLDGRVQSGAWAGAEVRLSGARLPARIGDSTVHTVGGDGAPLVVPAGGFAQAQPALTQNLARRAIELLAPTEKDDAAELFAGAGNFTVALAPRVRSLVAVELNPEAVEAARRNLANRGLSVELSCGDADAFDLPPRVRLVLLDPPRTGAPGAAERMARSRALRVVYVSCDASTLARDVGRLAQGGFELRAVETFEMFPHTSHVEIVVLLERASRKGRAP
jgi:23S rRNA (uracil1939-C5)-methyltransferase